MDTGTKDIKTKGEATRLRVIETAKQLVNAKGFNNTSISDIIQATGVKKGNLYFHFSSKEALAQEILKDAAEEFFRFLDASLRGDTPLKKLSSFFDAVLEKHREVNFVGGCIFGNTALEQADTNPRIAGIVEGVFRRWTGVLEGVLMEAGHLGELPPGRTSHQIAKLIVATIEGGIMVARLTKREEDLGDVLDSLRVWLGMAPSP